MKEMEISARNVRFAYSGKSVVNGFSADFSSRRFYGIIGPNGCGKTTLLDLLFRQIRPSEGEIELDGKSIEQFTRRRLASRMALVPQNFYINFPYTAEAVVLMGRYPHIPRFSAPAPSDLEIVREVMEEADVTPFADRFVTELSGGERQRVVFARALAQDAPILVLDEATSNLDVGQAVRLLGIARRNVDEKGATVIAVFQDINLAALFCDEIIFMQEGKAVASGTADKVLNPETIRSVFHVESKVYIDPFCGSPHVVVKR
jgi:iron complex transport system ATP-binding protein